MSREPGDPLARWRTRLKPWLMAAVRLAVGGVISAEPFGKLLSHGPWLSVAPDPLRTDLLIVLLGGGLLAFAWPRTVLPGAAVLALGLVGFQVWWLGGPLHEGRLPASLAIVAVLALREWLVRRVRARYPGS